MKRLLFALMMVAMIALVANAWTPGGADPVYGSWSFTHTSSAYQNAYNSSLPGLGWVGGPVLLLPGNVEVDSMGNACVWPTMTIDVYMQNYCTMTFSWLNAGFDRVDWSSWYTAEMVGQMGSNFVGGQMQFNLQLPATGHGAPPATLTGPGPNFAIAMEWNLQHDNLQWTGWTPGNTFLFDPRICYQDFMLRWHLTPTVHQAGGHYTYAAYLCPVMQ